MISYIVIAHIYPLGMFTIKAGMLSLLFIIPNRSLAYNSLIGAKVRFFCLTTKGLGKKIARASRADGIPVL